MSDSKYYGRDISTIRANLISEIQKKAETLTQFTASDPATILVDAVSEVADYLNYYIDQGRIESYISECQQDDSLLKLAAESSYFIKGVQPPSVELEITASGTEYSASRLQVEIDSKPYVIVSPIELDSTGLTTTVVAYNGTAKSSWVSSANLDSFDTRFVLGDYTKIPLVGMELWAKIGTEYERLRNQSWYPVRNSDDNIEIVVLDSRVSTGEIETLTVKYIEIEPDEFQALSEGDTATVDTLTITAVSASTTGSGPEDYETSRRNIIGNNTLLNTIISVNDFESVADQDLEVRKAKALDINSSLITDASEVRIYIDLVDTEAELSTAITYRLEEEFSKRNVILGVTPTVYLATKVKFDAVVSIKSYATDMVDVDGLEEYLLEKYRDLPFGDTVSRSELISDIMNYSEYIDYVDLTGPESDVTTNENEVPYLASVTISLVQR